ncbi:Branched-chain amino acid transport system [Candidatus Magnetaquicoccaceae bacterium FCR-1]|uniref:Branched-chain amino acid transport system n=1 Tax=Candidatus Magnetaquiglobus chichijimensis TaxID=3141448 RepID=A0ABQ0C4I7_9PROT
MNGHILAQQVVNGLVLGSVYGLIAVGYTMVYGIIGMINFAHGDVYMIAAYLTAIVLAALTAWGLQSIPVVILLVLAFTMVVTALYGWSVERIAYRPLRASNRLAPLISAIGMSLILQNYVRLSQGARTQGTPTLLDGGVRLFDGGPDQFVQITHAQILIVVTAIVGMGLLWYLIHGTAIGRACRAVQQDRVMASLLGVDTDRVIAIVFVLGAGMAGVAGSLVTFNYGSFDFFIGFVTGIKAFTAAVLGGIGSLPGAMLGGVILGLAESIFSGFVNTDYKDVFAFALLVLVLIFRPSGLLGRPEVEKV